MSLIELTLTTTMAAVCLTMDSKASTDNPDLEEIVVVGAERVTEEATEPDVETPVTKPILPSEKKVPKRLKRWRDTSPSYASIAAESTSLYTNSPPSYRRFESPKPPPDGVQRRRSSGGGILRTDLGLSPLLKIRLLPEGTTEPVSPARSADRMSVTFAFDDDQKGYQ